MQANYGENEIKSILQKVKIFNKNLGVYQLFAITENFDYAVKLSNGKIIIKIEELQDDEKEALTAERLTAIANRFVSSTPDTKNQEQKVISTPAKTTQQSPIKSNGLTWTIISIGILAVIVGVAVLIKNNSSSNHSPSTSTITSNNNNNNPLPSQKAEYKLKQDLRQKEVSNSLNYLTVNYTWKVNLASNTIIEGNIYNSATIAGFKNITIKVSFYSKTDMLLGEETFTVMEFVNPQGNAHFRKKITHFWKDASNTKYVVLSADTY